MTETNKIAIRGKFDKRILGEILKGSTILVHRNFSTAKKEVFLYDGITAKRLNEKVSDYLLRKPIFRVKLINETKPR